MKKILACAPLVLLSPFALSDVVGVYAGAGTWSAEPDGSVGSTTDTSDEPITASELGLEKDSNTYFYIALEHPVPIIPNIRLARTELKTSGSAVVTREFQLDEVTFVGDADTRSEMDLSHTDVTLYYEVLDNWVSLDLGLTGRVMDASARIDGTVETEAGIAEGFESVELDGTLPMLYTRAQFDLPFSGWHVGGKLNYIGYSGDKFTDFDMTIGYLSDGLALDVGFEVGYRQFNIEVDDDEDLTADISFDGPHASLIVHF